MATVILLLTALSHLCQVSFATEAEYVDILKGGNATLTCKIPSGGICDNILWVRYKEQTPNHITHISSCTTLFNKFNGLSEEDDRQRFIPVEGASSINLDIKYVKNKDTDYIYKCKRRAGQQEANVRIRIHTPICQTSVINKWSKSSQYEVNLACTINAQAKLTWYALDKSQTPLALNDSSKLALTVFLHLSDRDNYKRFICVATPLGLSQDPNGSAFCQVTPLQIPPVVEIIPSTLTISPGNNATFTCKPRESYPQNAYVFFINNTPLPPSSVQYITRTNPSSSDLIFINVSTHDSNSNITCVVYNVDDSDENVESKVATLYVSKSEQIVSLDVSSFTALSVSSPVRRLHGLYKID